MQKGRRRIEQTDAHFNQLKLCCGKPKKPPRQKKEFETLSVNQYHRIANESILKRHGGYVYRNMLLVLYGQTRRRSRLHRLPSEIMRLVWKFSYEMPSEGIVAVDTLYKQHLLLSAGGCRWCMYVLESQAERKDYLSHTYSGGYSPGLMTRNPGSGTVHPVNPGLGGFLPGEFYDWVEHKLYPQKMIAYKIIPRMILAHQLPTIRGTLKEQTEGILHLSVWDSVGSTLVRKFSGHRRGLVLVKVDLEKIIHGGRVHPHSKYPSIRGPKPYIDEDAIVWVRLLKIEDPLTGKFLVI